MLRHDQLRLAACLAHTAPGVTIELVCTNDERWFATLIDHDRVGRILAGNEFGLSAHAVDVRLFPDSELGVTAVRIICDGAFAGCVDEVSSWALAACMVDELLTDLHPNPTKTRNHP